jgi:hypothetical protein
MEAQESREQAGFLYNPALFFIERFQQGPVRALHPVNMLQVEVLS